ncbi:MAG: hypothetical protein RLZZ126_506, partial [Pseudomonadota bacterium]
MLIQTHNDGFIHPHSSEITPAATYQNRRSLMKRLAAGAAGATLAGWAQREAMAQGGALYVKPDKLATLAGGKSGVAGAMVMERITDYKDASTYSNFYEFGTDKSDPAHNAHTLKTKPWSVAVEGLVKKPATY